MASILRLDDLRERLGVGVGTVGSNGRAFVARQPSFRERVSLVPLCTPRTAFSLSVTSQTSCRTKRGMSASMSMSRVMFASPPPAEIETRSPMTTSLPRDAPHRQ